MAPTKKPKKSQVAKFRALARELECDQDEAAFKAKLKEVAKAPAAAPKAPKK